MVNEIDYKPFDVRAVVVLIRHDHDRAVAQLLDVLVLRTNFQSYNLAKVRYLWVFADLLGVSLTDVQKFTS